METIKQLNEKALHAIEVETGLALVLASDNNRYLCKHVGTESITRTGITDYEEIKDEQKKKIQRRAAQELRQNNKTFDIFKEYEKRYKPVNTINSDLSVYQTEYTIDFYKILEKR